jgi:hypothetical protein
MMFLKLALLLPCLFLLLGSSVGQAVNWTYLQRQEGTLYGPCTAYFDSDSVSRENNKVLVWILWTTDEPYLSRGVHKILYQQEILQNQTGWQRARREMHLFGPQDRVINRYRDYKADYYQVAPDSLEAHSLEKIFLAAKERPFNTSTASLKVPGPQWQQVAVLPEGTLYLDKLTLTVWPDQPFDRAQVTAKLVWNKEALDARKKELAAFKLKLYPVDYRDINYTVFTYQFKAAENLCHVYQITDYDAFGQRCTLLDGVKLHKIVPGSREAVLLAAIRKQPGLPPVTAERKIFGLPWGITREEVEKRAQSQNWEKIPKGFYASSALNYNITFAGFPARLSCIFREDYKTGYSFFYQARITVDAQKAPLEKLYAQTQAELIKHYGDTPERGYPPLRNNLTEKPWGPGAGKVWQLTTPEGQLFELQTQLNLSDPGFMVLIYRNLSVERYYKNLINPLPPGDPLQADSSSERV